MKCAVCKFLRFGMIVALKQVVRPELMCGWLSLLALVLAAGISAQVSPPPSDLPSDQQVLAFLTESIDWYRHRVAEEQVAIEPADLLFLEENRPVATQVVQRLAALSHTTD